jgi:hypothetical protein
MNDFDVRTASGRVPSQFRQAVDAVLAEVDGLVATSSRQSVDQATKECVLGEIDEELKLKSRTIYMIKKGSIESMLAYQQALLDLYIQIEFE